MDLRRIAWWAAVCVTMLLAAGCTDPMLGLGEPDDSTLDLARQPGRRSPLPGRQGAAGETRNGRKDPEPAELCMLYLVRQEGGVPAGPYNQTARVARAEPAKAAWLVGWLTEPSGQGGSGERQFLVYGDAVYMRWAGDVARRVDVPAGEADAWAAAVQALYAAGPRVTVEAGKAVLAKLEPLCASPADRQRQWAACVLAGRVHDEVLGDRQAAADRYEQAATLAAGTDPGWLVASYLQARALDRLGKRAEAERVARQIVTQAADRYGQVRPYRQAEQIAQGTR